MPQVVEISQVRVFRSTCHHGAGHAHVCLGAFPRLASFSWNVGGTIQKRQGRTDMKPPSLPFCNIVGVFRKLCKQATCRVAQTDHLRNGTAIKPFETTAAQMVHLCSNRLISFENKKKKIERCEMYLVRYIALNGTLRDKHLSTEKWWSRKNSESKILLKCKCKARKIIHESKKNNGHRAPTQKGVLRVGGFIRQAQPPLGSLPPPHL